MRGWLLSFMLSLPSVAWADGLDGTWVLDLPASDSNDPLLAAQGVSWVARQAAKHMVITQVIDDHGYHVLIDLKNWARTYHYDLRVDGVARTETLEDGRSAIAMHRRYADGSVVSEMRIAISDGRAGDMTIHRKLQDGGRTMLQTTTWAEPGKAPLVIRRIFHLQAAPP